MAHTQKVILMQRQEEIKNENIDVIFVGAGPVGLFTAIQIKLYNPHLSIVMFEKYAEYQRKHPLLLSHDSFVDTHTDKKFQQFIDQIPKTIRTNELESLLLDYARELGIIIDYQPVTSCRALCDQYPDTEIIIGSDGSHSVIHKEIFNHEYQIQKTLQYIAEIKYEVSGGARYLNTLVESIFANAYAKHLVSEFIGKEKDGKTPVSLRIFIDENVYAQMKEATFKNPFNLSKPDKIEASLYKSIEAWLIAREEMTKEKRIVGSERISVTNLPVYASQDFYKKHENKHVFLVGDAAFGVPYFRSLNNGILCSSQLAKVISALVLSHKIEQDVSIDYTSFSMPAKVDPIEYYKNYMQTLLNHENLVVEAKNLGVNTLESSSFMSQKAASTTGVLFLTPRGLSYKARMKTEKPFENPGNSYSFSTWVGGLFSQFIPSSPIKSTLPSHDIENSPKKGA